MISEISGFVEDRISWSRVIANDADLYGKRSRHWSTTDPISSLILVWAVWLLLSVGGLCRIPDHFTLDAIEYRKVIECSTYLIIAAVNWPRSNRSLLSWHLFVLVALPCALATPEARFTRNVSQYHSLATRIPLISSYFMQLSSLMRQSLGNVGSVVLYKAVESTKMNLLGQLKLCIPILMGRAVLSDISNVTKKRKRGRKTNEDQSKHDAMVKMTALGLFTDSRLRSMQHYLHDHEMEFLRFSLGRFIESESRLRHVLEGDRRRDPQLVAEATNIIQRRFCRGDNENNENVEPTFEAIRGDAQDESRTIFDSSELEDIADNLDFSSLPRRTRDGSKVIHIHNKVNSSETVKFLTFLLANRVMAHSKLEQKDRKKVLEHAATVIFYNHGYRKV